MQLLLNPDGKPPADDPRFAARERVLELVRAELLGPQEGPDEEIAEESVLPRYILGRLAPLKTPVGAAVADPAEPAVDDLTTGIALESDADEASSDDGRPAERGLAPSAFGLSFSVVKHATEIIVHASWARYTRIQSAVKRDANGAPARVWRRQAFSVENLRLRLQDGLIGSIVLSPEDPDARLRGVVRVEPTLNVQLVTLFFENHREAPRTFDSADWIFQPELVIRCAEPRDGFVARRRRPDALSADSAYREEDAEQRVHYGRRSEFVVGRNVAARATRADNPARAIELRTEFFPTYRQPVTQPTSPDTERRLEGLPLDMQHLASLDGPALARGLAPLPEAYESWIKEQIDVADREIDREVSAARGEERKAAERIIERLHDASARIRAGIECLRVNPIAQEAFRFANQAMHLQRIRSLYAASVRRKQPRTLRDFDTAENRSWRLFQLAFILINLPSLVDPLHPDRNSVCDLLWFPTGGGKTEAYLGLAALVLSLRRLQGRLGERDGEQGVAVLMRYTLRLLTLQQFQRASALIAACEVLRRERVSAGDTRYGNAPFRIGLWVGRRTTPNSTQESAEAVRRFRGHARAFGGAGSPHQLTACPWCGRDLNPATDYHVEEYAQGRARTLVFCNDPAGDCDFSARKSPAEGLPIVVVDEEIYRNPPALLIATVDKFAQMPWKGEIQALFGQVQYHCSRHGFWGPSLDDAQRHPKTGSTPAAHSRPASLLRPPDLIIQDELHLISGPLGTLAGIYETAVDELCTWSIGEQKIRPRLITSTATIRLAPEQIRRLFARETRIFPPPGVFAEDNFFSREVDQTASAPGRVYLGVNAGGERIKVILIRVYVAFLSAAEKVFQERGESAEAFMTLVGYFNSLRELGGMRRLVEDDIRTRLRSMEKRGLGRRQISEMNIEELTSRKSATDIPGILDRLETPFSLNREQYRTEERYPIDVLLATNMISVGVDIPRLALMVVAGQPKTSSEYIQATSRVGRGFPGIVCTVYNWTRPRDLAHYERFEHYHDTLYRHVEANTVTPFAPAALERGLPGALVALLRLGGLALNANADAHAIANAPDLVERARRVFLERVQEIAPEQKPELERRLNRILDLWIAQTGDANRLTYRPQKGDFQPLLLDAGAPRNRLRLSCLNSLRDVERSVNLVMLDARSAHTDGE